MRPTRLPAALLALAALATGANAQQPFTWQGSLAAGRTIEIANLNGDERVPARVPGDGKLKPIEDAPGSYVGVRLDGGTRSNCMP